MLLLASYYPLIASYYPLIVGYYPLIVRKIPLPSVTHGRRQSVVVIVRTRILLSRCVHVSALCSTTLAYLLITLGHKNHESLHFECGCAGSISAVTDVVNIVKMDLLYNLTGLNQEVYFAVNSAAYILLFLAISLPSLILCILCILALFFAKDVNWIMKALIINMFAAEICNRVAYSVLLLGFPTRFSGKIADNYSCKIAMSLLVVAPQMKFAATALYSVMVYLLIRYGI